MMNLNRYLRLIDSLNIEVLRLAKPMSTKKSGFRLLLLIWAYGVHYILRGSIKKIFGRARLLPVVLLAIFFTRVSFVKNRIWAILFLIKIDLAISSLPLLITKKEKEYLTNLITTNLRKPYILNEQLTNLRLIIILGETEKYYRKIFESIPISKMESYTHEVGMYSSVFRSRGLYHYAEWFEVKSYRELSIIAENQGHQLSISNEIKYLSSIGHMSIADYLYKNHVYENLKSSKVAMLIRNPNLKVNELLRAKIENWMNKVGIQVNPPSILEEHSLISNMEVLPTKFHIAWEPTSRKMSRLEEYFSDQPPILLMTEFEVQSAENILRELFPYHRNLDFIGFHFRKNSSQHWNTRDSDISFCIQAILSCDKNSLLLGVGQPPDGFRFKMHGSRVIWIRRLNISDKNKDLLEVYAWAKSKCFIGNHSGGTHPGRLFGTPTLWLDYHPITQHRPPSSKDYYLPKNVYDEEGIALDFAQIFSLRHAPSQTESLFDFIDYGYSFKRLPKQVERAITEFLIQITSKNSESDVNPHYKEYNILKNNNLHPGAYISASYFD